MKSDASRYLWFDWQSRWSSIEVQPSSIAKYSLAGLPYFSKTFEYSTQLMEELNDSENYLTKLSRARQNYMPNWAYSPYLYNKVSNWFNNRYSNLFFNDVDQFSTKSLLKLSAGYWKPILLEGSLTFHKAAMTPSSSGLTSPARVTWTPIRNLAGSYYTESILIDILSKREHLYRTFLKSKNNTISIPSSLTAAPNNNLLREIKSVYSFIDPATYGSEVTREFLYQNSNYLRYIFIKDFLRLTNELHFQIPINFNLISNYFIHILGPMDSYTNIGKNTDLYKSQYRPMRKGVTNMIRLQATNAIAMPTEIRLHILASSKDVIHSWAIPSAGIKIDCVPGYSSHRVAIFLTHGIYWGQCMEICGRYHHWMPIVVYFMKRDLFFLWCTHFMHYSNIENSFNMTDRQLADYLRLVSYNKSTWINELDNYIK
jgi:heme/copper-type cytochrome/quinol oxidase subunit 2